MSRIERTWPADAFDAISLMVPAGQFEVKGSDGDQVELEAEFEMPLPSDWKLEPEGRWLQLALWRRVGEARFSLRLPKRRAWVVELTAARAAVEAADVQARWSIRLGQGDIEAQNCRGVFNLAVGRGEVALENCAEAEAPERPPLPESAPAFQGVSAPPGPGAQGEFPGRGPRGPRGRMGRGPVGPWNWMSFDAEDWAEWGAQFAEHAGVWAEQFANHFLSQTGWPSRSGVSLRQGQGDARLQGLEAQSCSLRLASGDVELKGGRVANLSVKLSHGDIECEAVLPTGDWALDLKHGDIRLALPAETRARLDVATRHGDIDSAVPLVRVGRPGPGARHGRRMVGTLGQADDQVPQLNLATLSGDIEIELLAAGPRAAPPAPAAAPEAVATPRAETGAAGGQAAPPAETPAAAAARPEYDSQLAILKALSEGHIGVEEAEQLLRQIKA